MKPIRSSTRPYVAMTPPKAEHLEKSRVPPMREIHASQRGETRLWMRRSPVAIKKTLPKASPTLSSANVSRYSVYERPWSWCAACVASFSSSRP